MSARQTEQARQDVERQATPAAEDVRPMRKYWQCRCGVSGGSR